MGCMTLIEPRNRYDDPPVMLGFAGDDLPAIIDNRHEVIPRPRLLRTFLKSKKVRQRKYRGSFGGFQKHGHAEIGPPEDRRLAAAIQSRGRPSTMAEPGVGK